MIRPAPRTLTALVLSIVAAATLAADPVTIQIGANVPANSPWDLGLKKLAAEWSRISGGAVRMVFPKSVSSSSQEDVLQKMKFSLDGAMLDTTGLSYIDGDIFMLAMPSVIEDDVEFDQVMAAVLPLLRAEMGDRYEILAVAKGGWIRFFSTTPIVVPDDLRNLRMAVDRNQDMLAKLLQSIGVRTVKNDASSTILQLNAGALDAIYTSPLLVATLWSQYRRVVSYMSPFRVSPFFGAIVVNKRAWDRVPAAMKPALLEAAQRIAREIGEESMRLENEGIASMVKNGLVVPAYSPADAAAWETLYAGRIRSVVASWFSEDFAAAVYRSMGK